MSVMTNELKVLFYLKKIRERKTVFVPSWDESMSEKQWLNTFTIQLMKTS